ncbi:MAG: alkyl hydroperoxide reductase subunit F [Deltaproteobacteria bacterium]|nr:MAG: alkyl hydroperoxide reductase subunit F [Deltaproteobacteria bacterium]TNF25334.1 MAG: alkyl hydroperoxide reductase subunit F [Deltaproteobacteria bacterium]
MLDANMIEQLKAVFEKLEQSVELVFDNSEHPKQGELVEMLNEISSTSDKISTISSGNTSDYPKFLLKYKGLENGIHFSGIPGGHEFTSLILAILNSDLKGKLPDEMIQQRIKRLKGPISLKTYISLSCENCPDVVQALNLMAIFNENITHEMVDGEFEQAEIERLKIQGVPSVMDGDQLVSSGKISFADLLEKLEHRFGTEEASESTNQDLGVYDVVIVGGGPAGASAAIYTARKGLKTAIIAEKIGGQVQDTKGIENLISVPYTEGPQLSASLFKHISEYDIKVLEHRRVDEVIKGEMKELKLNSGETIKTKALVVTTGAKWRELGIEGEKEYIGRGVAFCPHCDGPYYKGKDVAVIGGGNSGVEAAIDLAGIVKSVTLVEFAPELKADQVLVQKLQSLPNVTIIKNARTDKIIGDGDKVVSLDYEDRANGEIKNVKLDGVFVQIGLIPNSAFVKDVVETNRFGEIVVSEKNRTSVDGIYAAGDVTTVPYKQIIIAMGEGAKAGLTVFEDLML